MTKNDVECQVHTWMIKKAKTPWYIRRRKTEEEKKTEKKKKRNQISRACLKRLIASLYARIFNLFTLKSNILAQDQTSFLSCTL